MTTILLTGYEPFDDYETNPSATLAERFDGETVDGAAVVGEVLPVEFERTNDRLRGFVDEHEPTAVVSMGLAPERAAINVERVGINVNSCAGVPDNAGAEPRNEPILPDGEDAYFASLPVVDLVEALIDAGIPARVSNTAGTHLCNNALYSVREHVDRNDLDAVSGFVHLPFTPELAIAEGSESAAGGGVPPSMPLDLQEAAVRRILAALS